MQPVASPLTTTWTSAEPLTPGYCSARPPLSRQAAPTVSFPPIIPPEDPHAPHHRNEVPAGAGGNPTLGRAGIEVGRALLADPGRHAQRQHPHHRLHVALPALHARRRQLLDH